MHWIKTSLISGIFMLCSWTPGFCADAPDKKVTAIYIEGEIVVDGNLDEPQWDLAQPATDFIQNDPRMGEPATERTEVRLLYDDENIYVGVYCFDSAGENGLILTDVRRDYAARENDYFSVIFDTFDDNRNGFIFGPTQEEPRETVRLVEIVQMSILIGIRSGTSRPGSQSQVGR